MWKEADDKLQKEENRISSQGTSRTKIIQNN
jgi:hypothetical protein